ncbi:MAG: VTT domain-containing protein, partial [Gammaproteobacteria bacterium]
VEVPGKPAYRPFHDVQILVEGYAARALGDLVRDRWQRATVRRIQPTPPASAGAPWPDGLAPDVTDVALAIARTDPAYDGRPEVREIELLYRDAIRAARRYIYVENQFLTANGIVDALTARLAESDGPEIVLVLALRTDGWLSQQTMDVLRSRMVDRLRRADRHGRLRVYYPDLPGLEPHCINVHSKVMIVDDEFVRVGSANLNNRSMGIDTECDVAFEASGDERVRHGIRGFRDRLLAEHLGQEPAQVTAAIAHRGVIAGIDALRGGTRTLREFAPPSPEEIKSWLPNPELLDPERPIDPDKLADEFVPPDERVPAHRRLMLGLGLLVTLLGLAAAWKWTPLGEWLNVETLSDYIALFSDGPAAPFIAIGAFLLGGVLVAPVTLLVVVTALAFGPVQGSIYSLVGSVASAALLYGIGHALGRNTVRRLAGSRLNRLSKRLGERGIIAITVLRMLPVAPFSVVNLVAGASHIRFRDFIIGTVLGLLPGVIAINFFVDRVGATFQNPGIGSALALVAVVLLIAAGAIWLRRWATRRSGPPSAASSSA